MVALTIGRYVRSFPKPVDAEARSLPEFCDASKFRQMTDTEMAQHIYCRP